MQLDLKQSEVDRERNKVTTTVAYAKSLEQDLLQAREESQRLNQQLNLGQDINIKTVGKTNKQDVLILELKDQIENHKTETTRLQTQLGEVHKSFAAEQTKC